MTKRCNNCNAPAKKVEVYDVQTKETEGFKLTCPNAYKNTECDEIIEPVNNA